MLAELVLFASVGVWERVSEIKGVLVSETMSLTTNQRLSSNTDKDGYAQDL